MHLKSVNSTLLSYLSITYEETKRKVLIRVSIDSQLSRLVSFSHYCEWFVVFQLEHEYDRAHQDGRIHRKHYETNAYINL